MYFLKSSTGTTVTFSLINSVAPTIMNTFVTTSPDTGIGAAVSTYLYYNSLSTAATTTFTSGGTLAAANHFAAFSIYLANATGTSLQLQIRVVGGGATVTPLIGSYWMAQRLPPNNIGHFSA